MSGQQARRAARDAEKELRQAGDRLIAAVLAEPAIIDAVSKTRIDSLVEAGHLIPSERLVLGPGFELTPRGRLAELEEAIIEALDLLEADDGRKAMMALLKVMPDPEPDQVEDQGPGSKDPVDVDADPVADPEPEAPEDDDEDGPESAIAAALAGLTAGPDEPEPEPAATGRPNGMPGPDDIEPCAVCGDGVPFDQSSMSWIRFRRVLCRPHFEGYNPKAAAEPATEAAAGPAENLETAPA